MRLLLDITPYHNPPKTLTANVTRVSAGILGSRALGVLVQLAIARRLGVEAFGFYAAALAYVALWQVLMDAGLNLLTTRETAGARSDPLLRAVLTLKPVTLVTGYAGLVGLAWLVGVAPEFLRLAAILGVAAVATSAAGLGHAILRGHEDFGTEAACLILQRMLFALLVIVVLVSSGGVRGVAIASAASSGIMAAVVWLVLRHRYRVRPHHDLGALRTHGKALVRTAGPLLAAEELSQVQVRVAPLILQAMRGVGDAGVFAAPWRIIEGVHLLPTAFATALFPRLATAFGESRWRFASVLWLGLRVALAVALGALLAGLLVAEPLVRLVFGAAYASSVPVLRVLLLAFAVMSVNAVLTLALIAAGLEAAWVGALAAAAVASVAVNLVLVPGLGASGSGWAALAGETVLCAGCALALRGALARKRK